PLVQVVTRDPTPEASVPPVVASPRAPDAQGLRRPKRLVEAPAGGANEGGSRLGPEGQSWLQEGPAVATLVAPTSSAPAKPDTSWKTTYQKWTMGQRALQAHKFGVQPPPIPPAQLQLPPRTSTAVFRQSAEGLPRAAISTIPTIPSQPNSVTSGLSDPTALSQPDPTTHTHPDAATTNQPTDT
ncbi:hypothetical protein CYMTET_39802, partial [Cymbomonas tetramitiformis]